MRRVIVKKYVENLLIFSKYLVLLLNVIGSLMIEYVLEKIS